MMAMEQRGRRGGQRWMSSLMMVAGALSVALASYTISLKVSAERKAAEALARENRLLSADIERLGAELRVRMRLPQLERWNSNVLGLKPIAAEQFVADPLHLAHYGTPLAGAPAQEPTLAVARNLEQVAPANSRSAALTQVVASGPAAVAAPAVRPPKPAERAAASPAAGIDPALIAAVEAMAAEARQQPRLSTVALDGGVAPPPRQP